MTEKMVKKMLEDLTKELADQYVIKRPLTDRVYYAKVWLRDTSKEKQQRNLLDFYFIQSADGDYWAAAQVEENAFSLFTITAGKKISELLQPLREIILPHILQQKTIQRATLSKIGVTEKALKEQLRLLTDTGFKTVREDDTMIRLAMQQTDRIDKPYIHGHNTGIPLSSLTGYETKLDLFKEELLMMKQAAILQEGDLGLSEDINDLMEQCQILSGKLAALQQGASRSTQ